jgi:GNAT superfamily N-acetyltransferase
VVPLDPEDEVGVARAQAVMEAAEMHDRPWGHPYSVVELTGRLRAQTSHLRVDPWVAVVGEEVVGVVLVNLPLRDNLTMAWPELSVDPAWWGRGVGSALVERALVECRAAGRTRILVETAVPMGGGENHPHVRFAEKHGFAYANTEVLRVLPLPVDPVRLTALADAVAVGHAAYRLETFTAPLPEELQESYCAVENQLAVDAPTGEADFEEEAMTPETYREEVASLARQARTMIATVALDASGRVVGFNDLVVPADDSGAVLQWGTLVHRGHRGHRLGMALKVRGLQELARRHPDRTHVLTWNAEQNAHMVGINVELGFEPRDLLVLFQRTLD